MQTPLTIATPGTQAGKTTGPNRLPPRPDETSPEQRFAALLQQRRDAAPRPREGGPEQAPQAKPREGGPEPTPQAKPREAGPEPAPQANSREGGPEPATQGKPQAKPRALTAVIARAPGADPVGTAAADKPAIGATPVASTGCEAAEPRRAGSATTRPPADWRDLPIIEVPMLPPTAAIDGSSPSSNAAADDRTSDPAFAADRSDAIPALPDTGTAFWPGMPLAASDAATTPPHGAVQADHGATLEWRVGASGTAGAAGTTAAGLPRAGEAAGDTEGTIAAGPHLTGDAAGSAAQHGADRRGGNDPGANAAATQDTMAARSTASNADAVATVNAAADRFTLAPRAPQHDIGATTLTALTSPAAPHRIDAGPAPAVALPTPLTAPDFAKALGAQVSLFARDGLAQAELQLTPAEMGPIRVHIAIDGAQARVDFAADSAATRQVIERGMPELASALREQGLTLAGGGVFQRAPDDRGAGAGSDSRATRTPSRRGAEPAEAVEPAAIAMRAHALAARRGGVDLYA